MTTITNRQACSDARKAYLDARDFQRVSPTKAAHLECARLLAELNQLQLSPDALAAKRAAAHADRVRPVMQPREELI